MDATSCSARFFPEWRYGHNKNCNRGYYIPTIKDPVERSHDLRVHFHVPSPSLRLSPRLKSVRQVVETSQRRLSAFMTVEYSKSRFHLFTYAPMMETVEAVGESCFKAPQSGLLPYCNQKIFKDHPLSDARPKTQKRKQFLQGNLAKPYETCIHWVKTHKIKTKNRNEDNQHELTGFGNKRKPPKPYSPSSLHLKHLLDQMYLHTIPRPPRHQLSFT